MIHYLKNDFVTEHQTDQLWSNRRNISPDTIKKLENQNFIRKKKFTIFNREKVTKMSKTSNTKSSKNSSASDAHISRQKSLLEEG